MNSLNFPPPHRVHLGSTSAFPSKLPDNVDPRQVIVHLDGTPGPERRSDLATWMKQIGCTQLSLDSPLGAEAEAVNDLEFLEGFDFLTSFALRDVNGAFRSWRGLRFVRTSLTDLNLGTSRKPHRIDEIASVVPNLRTLRVHGRISDAEFLAGFEHLEALFLWQGAVEALENIPKISGLRALYLQGGRLDTLDNLIRLPRLSFLDITSVRGVEDFTVLGRLPFLEVLCMDTMSKVRSVPDLTGSPRLRRLFFGTMSGLTDLAQLSTAPGLEQLTLSHCPVLAPGELAVLRQMPKLSRCSVALGSRRKDAAIAAILEGFEEDEPTQGWTPWDKW